MFEWLEALIWRLSQPGFDPSYGKILSSHTDEFLIERNRSVCGWLYIYIYIYIFMPLIRQLSISFRIWTLVTDSVSYDYNCYAKCASQSEIKWAFSALLHANFPSSLSSFLRYLCRHLTEVSPQLNSPRGMFPS